MKRWGLYKHRKSRAFQISRVLETDKLYETYANVRPSCKQGRCGDHKATHPHKKVDQARKRKRILNFNNISVAFKGQFESNSAEPKKQKTTAAYVAQITSDVAEIAPVLNGNKWEVTDDWVSTMTKYWKRLRGN